MNRGLNDVSIKDHMSGHNSYKSNYDMTGQVNSALNMSKNMQNPRGGFGFMGNEINQDLQSPHPKMEIQGEMMGKMGGSRQGNPAQSIGESAFNFQGGNNGNIQ